MTFETSSPGRDPSGARPNQHISSIAHLFFDNNADPSEVGRTQKDHHFLVVGTGRDTFAPCTAVGVGQHLLDQSATIGEAEASGSSLPIRQVYFAEPSPVCFSGVSHLRQGSYRPPAEGEIVPWSRRAGSKLPVLRLFPGDAPSEDFSGGMIDGRFFISHLDLPKENELNALETQMAAGGSNALGMHGIDGLIWCVPASGALSLAMTSRLGRLLKVVNPRKIFLNVYCEQDRTKSKGPSEATEALLHRSHRLLDYVAAGAVVHSTLIGDSSEERTVQLAILSRKLCI